MKYRPSSAATGAPPTRTSTVSAAIARTRSARMPRVTAFTLRVIGACGRSLDRPFGQVRIKATARPGRGAGAGSTDVPRLAGLRVGRLGRQAAEAAVHTRPVGG